MKIEIGEIENEVINWDINQLVIADDGEVVITTGNHEDNAFEGISFDEPIFSDDWAKAEFKKFNGKITLSNE